MTIDTDDYLEEIILINDDYYEYLLNDIERAKHAIELESFIFADDKCGVQIAAALSAAALRGVKVRVLVDGIGSSSWGGTLTRNMEEAGAESRVFHPPPWLFKHWVRTHTRASAISKFIFLIYKINKRNHRKVCVIDNKIVYVGSANINVCHLNKDKGGYSWRDTSVRLSGVDIRHLQYAFERAWGHLPLYKRARIAFRKIKHDPAFRLNYSRRQRRALYKDTLQRILTSKKRIWITNAYFVPDAILLERLIQAARRGVEVKILLSYHYDVIISSLVSGMFYAQLIHGGISIYEYMPSILHAKVLIIDDWYCLGTSNLNSRSLIHDLEIDVNIRTAQAQSVLEKNFLLDLMQAKKISLADIKKQPLYKKVLGRILLYIRYWL